MFWVFLVLLKITAPSFIGIGMSWPRRQSTEVKNWAALLSHSSCDAGIRLELGAKRKLLARDQNVAAGGSKRRCWPLQAAQDFEKGEADGTADALQILEAIAVHFRNAPKTDLALHPEA